MNKRKRKLRRAIKEQRHLLLTNLNLPRLKAMAIVVGTCICGKPAQVTSRKMGIVYHQCFDCCDKE